MNKIASEQYTKSQVTKHKPQIASNY